MTHFISGTFYDAGAANRAIDDIVTLGYPPDRINIMMTSATLRHFANGSAAARIGGTLGKIVSGGSGQAPLFVAGPAAASLADARLPATSVLGVLAGLGIPRHEAERLSRDVDAGGIVVGVTARDADRTDITTIMRRTEARNVLESLSAR